MGNNAIPFNNSGVLAVNFSNGSVTLTRVKDIGVYDKPENWISYYEWWAQDVIHLVRIGKGINLGNPKGSPENQLTRKEIVTMIADTDGGAHVDSALNPVYAQLSREPSIGGIAFGINGSEAELTNTVHLPTVRHIAEELLATMQRNNCLD